MNWKTSLKRRLIEKVCHGQWAYFEQHLEGVVAYTPYASNPGLAITLSFFFIKLFHGSTSSFLIHCSTHYTWLLSRATPVKTHQNSRKVYKFKYPQKQRSTINEYVSQLSSQIGYVETSDKPYSRCSAKGI